MKFFKECQTIDEVKALYKKLAKENHPDVGGDVVTMQAINTEYAYACAQIYKGAGLSDEQASEQMEYSEAYRQAIEKIIHLPGIVIELVGNWIWVTGDTRPVKDQIKEAGFFYASKKIAWYFRTDDYKCKGGKKSLDEIKQKYGSQTINGHQYRSIA
ncbi:molecular chaperone DnaJ [Mucilaginibacter paludis]|uniref:Heat shock protein DnaJ domain protein n=1 Tax=Mucilaginibacter paludis DSM 18603 TaxID=714943 RepID=H1YBW4_9SPHI|nr:molecular chaperone DnaJ [Mucilaginibacter paludis]EHQ27042.1 hypothetical protein Mucpa_2934 [Mucilaginibacter paludis DSM 18603]